MKKENKILFAKFLECWKRHQDMDNPDFETEVQNEMRKYFEIFKTGDVDFRDFILLPDDIILSIHDEPKDLIYWSPDGTHVKAIDNYKSGYKKGYTADWRSHLEENEYYESASNGAAQMIVILRPKDLNRVKSFRDFHS